MAFDTRVKDPEDKLDYLIDWRGGDKPGLGVDETISTSTWTVYDQSWATTPDLVTHPELETHDGTTATGWVSAGVRGRDYYFTNHIVTNEGRELSWSIKIKVREQ